MLPAQNRLRRRRDFQQLFRGGGVVRGKLLIARYISTTTTERAGFVVSTTIFKNATDRNRLRRQLQEIVRRVGIPNHTNVVISATTLARHQEYHTLQHELETIFQRIKRQSSRR